MRDDILILTVTLTDGSTWVTTLREAGEITRVMSKRGYERLKARVDRWRPTDWRDQEGPVIGWRHMETFAWPP